MPLTAGDRYIAKVTAHGWTANHIYTWDGATWIDTPPVIGMTVYDKNTLARYDFDGSNWIYTPETYKVKGRLTDGAPGFLDDKIDRTSIICNAGNQLQALPTHILNANLLTDVSDPDWKIITPAGGAYDSLNGAFYVVQFDDPAESGRGFILDLPASTTGLNIKIIGRAEVAPGVAKAVEMKLYTRRVRNNLAVTAWSAGLALNAIPIPTNTLYQYNIQSVSFAMLGIAANELTQFEITRNAGAGADTLTGIFNMLELIISFQ